jgi:hypothetical protein
VPRPCTAPQGHSRHRVLHMCLATSAAAVSNAVCKVAQHWWPECIRSCTAVGSQQCHSRRQGYSWLGSCCSCSCWSCCC